METSLSKRRMASSLTEAKDLTRFMLNSSVAQIFLRCLQ